MSISLMLKILALSLFMMNCGSSKNESDMAKKDRSEPEMPKRITEEQFAPPPSEQETFAPSTAGIIAEIVEVVKSGGEYRLEIKVSQVIGTGAGAPSPSAGKNLLVNYPVSNYDQDKYGELEKGRKIRMLLSNMPSITEGGEQWFCESIGYF